ncbi:MAG: MarC family protein [Ectothiorhodospiraceae bacterium]|jgi:MarC family membrane protein
MDTVSAGVTLFLIMDPIGNLPVFLSLLRDHPPRKRLWITVRELLFAYGVLLIFLFLGQSFMDVFGLKSEAMSIAAGIVLFLIAVRMIFPQRGGIMGEAPDGEVFFVPLAVPLLAGPSTLATLLIMVRQDPSRLTAWFGAMTVAWLATGVILLAGGFLYRILRERGLFALERLMGMLLVAISVQMLLDGVADFLARAG